MSTDLLNLTGQEIVNLGISVLIVILAILYGGKLLAFLLHSNLPSANRHRGRIRFEYAGGWPPTKKNGA